MNLFAWFQGLLAGKSPLTSKFAELSYIGHRDTNQDYLCHHFSKHGKLFILADGLGGHQGGELASRYFCNAFLTIARDNINSLKKQPEEALQQFAEKAAYAMSEKLIKDQPGMQAHTTCAIAWLSNDMQLSTLHIGDTRIYWLRNNQVVWHSRDHSVIQMKVDLGEITEKQMGTHPDQGALTRSIGVGRKINPSCKVHSEKLNKGDALLLCTDGLWERTSKNELISLGKTKAAERDLTLCIKTAIDRAKPRSDNVSAQLYIV